MKALQILEESLVTLKKERFHLEERRDKECTKYIRYNFQHLLHDEMEIDQARSSFRIQRRREEDTYKREIFEIRFEEKWYGDKGSEIKGVRISAYSTSERSDFELERLVAMGKCAEKLLSNGETLIEELSAIISKHKKTLSLKSEEVWNLEREIKEIKERHREEEQQALLNRLEKEGLEFGEIDNKTGKKCSYPSIDIAFNHEVKFVKRIKILSKTKSGKSANIELTLVQWEYNYDKVKDTQTQIQKPYTRTFENVRWKNIERLVSYNKKKIVQPNTVAS